MPKNRQRTRESFTLIGKESQTRETFATDGNEPRTRGSFTSTGKKPPPEDIRVVLFDLGGVLVEWKGVSALVEMTHGAVDEEQARRYWMHSKWVRKFETGHCTPRRYADGVIADLGLPVEPDDFIREFESWDRGLLPGAAALLGVLKKRYVVACLSNNNELHWKKLLEEDGLASRFHHTYVSHETGLLKPDRRAFIHAIRDIGVKPQGFLFFDDNRECVRAAGKVGMHAYQVAGVGGVKDVLDALHIVL
jgi:putative hydrolase of the HAD superfamily